MQCKFYVKSCKYNVDEIACEQKIQVLLSGIFVLIFWSLVHAILKARTLSGLPLPSPVDHVLSELSTMTCMSWVTLHHMAHSFIELDKAVIHVIS